MGWDRGRYYTRSKKVSGRVIREYLGAGEVAVLASQLDALEREEREVERAAWRAEQAEWAALDDPLDRMCQEAEWLARAALVVLGFRQHKRGEWRKRRDNRQSAEPDRSDGHEGTPAGAGACPEWR
jgi:hypothetical protein